MLMSKKVFIIISRLNIGGPTKLVNYLHENLNQYNFNSTLISGYPIEDEGEIKPQNNQENHIYISGLSPGANIFKSFLAVLKIYRLIKKNKPDIIHTHQAKAGLVGRIAGFLARTPVRIHTFHGHVFNNYFSKFKTSIIMSLERLLAKLSTKIIAISPDIEKAITKEYKITTKSKTIIQSIGIQINSYTSNKSKDSCRKEFNLPMEKTILGFVGRFAPIKDPLKFISLAENLLEKNCDYHFLIVGDGPLKESVHLAINASNNSNSFTILPWQNELNLLYRSLDLLVLTSKNEGTPLTILEAMISGTPTASTPVGGVKDLILDNETGILLQNDLNSMAETIIKLLSDHSLLNAIKQAGIQLVNDQYSMEHFLENTVKNYDSLIE